ncbi:MAG: discoidin domain-containing protein [Archangium sp.]
MGPEVPKSGALVAEDELTARHRRRSRELADAAAQLAANADAESLRLARATLHREGLLEAMRALAPGVAPTPLVLLAHFAARPVDSPLGEDEALLRPLLESRAGLSDDGTLPLFERAHERALAIAERDVRLRDEALKRRTRTLIAGAAVIAIALVLGAMLASWIAKPRNLAANKPWRLSSIGLQCDPAHHLCGGTRTDIFFHTKEEPNPWIEFDLGEPTKFSGLTVQNRRDMGVGRAVPLIVEASDDQQSWKQVARRGDPFDRWEPRFEPVTARYVRLRVEKKAWFHLEGVEVHP